MQEAAQPDSPEEKAPVRALVAWALYDWANSAFAAVISTFVFAAYFVRQVAADEVSGTTLWGYVIGVTGLVVAVAGPVLGAVADQGGRRKPWIALFTLLCIAATALMWFVKPAPDYIGLAVALAGLGTIGAEIAMIFYNAMLPGLAQHDHTGRWSGWGWSLGYAGGVLCLILALMAFIRTDHAWFQLDRDTAEHVRATFLFVAVWYLLFALPLFFVTPDSRGRGKTITRATVDGLRQLTDSLRHVRRYGHIVRFLIARMLFIDGLATLFAFGGVYAAGTFNMTAQEVLLFGIALNVTAGLGAGIFAWVDDWLGSKATIVLSLWALIILGVPLLVAESQTLFWVLGLMLGVFVGPVQAASRSYMARTAPAALRTEMFGLLALSGKATAFLGPLMVGWVTSLSGSQRMGMGVIIVFFTIGLLLMMMVPSTGKVVDSR